MKQTLNKKKALQKAKIDIIKTIQFNIRKVISANKIFIFIISFLIFIWLLNTTFIKKENSILKEIDYKITQESNFLNIKYNSIVYTNSGTTEDLEIKYLSLFDKIIIAKGEVKSDKNIIDLNKGFFLINIGEINSKYEIKGEGFRINTNGPMSFIIDNSGTRTTIFSINSRIDLDLINIENNKIVNSLNLYPNTYIKITPNQNKNIENADLLRLTQRFTLDYFNEKLYLNGNLNNQFLEKVIGEKEKNDIEKIKKAITFLSLKEEENSNLLKNIKNIKIGFLLGEKLIKQYHILFVNENKKTVYYKNLIVEGLGDILNKGASDVKNKFLIETIDELKKINEEEYNKIKTIIDYYIYLAINSYDNKVDTKLNVSKLYAKIEGKKYEFNDENLLLLNELYFKYNFRNYNELYKDLNYINNNIGATLNNESKRSYFIFYLNKIIFSGFKELDEDKKIVFGDIIGLFNIYGRNSIDYYSINDNVRIKTGIVEYNNILNKLINQIRISYFEKDLNKQGLLVINKGNNLEIEKINALEINMGKIIQYYYDNKVVLSGKGKDELTQNQFETSKLKYDEYILALKDYQSYVANYNEQNKKLLFGETANQGDDSGDNITIENAFSYLKQFNYLDIGNTKISLRGPNYCNNQNAKYDIDGIEEPYCYKIENLVIGSGLYLDMILSPKEYNNIYNFNINGNKNLNKGSYKLDAEKIIWDENYKKSSGTSANEKTRFENFFLYVFNPPKETNNNTIIENNNTEALEESIIVRIFKINKLLGETGDFNIVKGFLNIKYENTIVEENNDNFNIYVKNGEIFYESGEIFYKGFFSGRYEFLPGHNFVNPSIKFVNKVESDMYFGNSITFEGSYNINKIKDELLSNFSNLNNLNNILTSLESKNGIKDYEIIYKKDDNIFYIKNTENGIDIKMKGISIQSLIYNGRERISKAISIFEFKNTLELIK